MNKSLAVIVSESTAIEQMLIESEGVMTPEIEAFLKVNEKELPAKVDSYSLVMERFEDLEAFYKRRAEFFYSVAKSCKNVREGLKENIKYAMGIMGATEIKGGEVRFALTKVKPSLVIENEQEIPQDYYKSVVVVSLDKDRLKEDLTVGPVPGAKLQESFSLRTYANTPKSKKKVKDE